MSSDFDQPIEKENEQKKGRSLLSTCNENLVSIFAAAVAAADAAQ